MSGLGIGCQEACDWLGGADGQGGGNTTTRPLLLLTLKYILNDTKKGAKCKASSYLKNQNFNVHKACIIFEFIVQKQQKGNVKSTLLK